MSLVSFTPVTDGSTATAAGVNTPLSTIYNDYNGNITDANISASAAIGAQKLAGGVSGMFGAWATYTPTLTGMSLGNGTMVASYKQLGKTVFFRVQITFGTTTTLPGAATDNKISAPVAINTSGNTQYYTNLAQGVLKISSTGYILLGMYFDTNTVVVQGAGTLSTGQAAAGNTTTFGSPAAGSILQVQGSYEAA